MLPKVLFVCLRGATADEPPRLVVLLETMPACLSGRLEEEATLLPAWRGTLFAWLSESVLVPMRGTVRACFKEGVKDDVALLVAS